MDSQECIRRLNGAYAYLIKTHPQVYTLSIEGREYGSEVVGKYKEEAKKNSSLRATIEYITEKVRAYNILKKKFESLENDTWTRKRIEHETGIIYETDTIKKLEFEKKLNIASINISKEKLMGKKQSLLSKNQKNDLIVLNSQNATELVEFEEKKEKEVRDGFSFNGEVLNSIERRDIEKKLKGDKKLDKAKAKVGLREVEVEREHYERFEHLKKKLGIVQETKNLKELKKDEELCLKIIQQIKYKKWMDVWLVQQECGNKRVYSLFLELAAKNDIVDDGDDFRYVGEEKLVYSK